MNDPERVEQTFLRICASVLHLLHTVGGGGWLRVPDVLQLDVYRPAVL